MASVLTKRQQARNERALQDLLRSVAGNDRCADCAARNPGWASWSLGIFLCMRCATLHRKLGTHVSKVKSLSMDSWSNDQVDHMKHVGNAASNRIYNPNNVKPNIPVDIDEVEGALERFIRQKYEHKSLSGESQPTTRQNTGSTGSVEDRPPPLPPKPGRRFGFGLRTSSATFPASKSALSSPPSSPGVDPSHGVISNSAPPRVNKASRVFGHDVRSTAADGFETKLQTLKEMGFSDENRNTTVLKGLHGNMEKSVETLIKLGAGGRTNTTPGTRDESANGLSIGRPRPTAPLPSMPSTERSTNPFDMLHSPQESTYPQNPGLQPHPTGSSLNPFLPASRPPAAVQPSPNQPYPSLQQQQQLFPNHTGGYGTHNQQQGYNPFLRSPPPPPVPHMPPLYTGSQQSQPPSGQQEGLQFSRMANQALKTSRSQIFHGSNPFHVQNPSSPTGPQPISQQPQWQWQDAYVLQGQVGQQQQYHLPSQPQVYAQNPYHHFLPQSGDSFNSVPREPRLPVRQDNNSILALYNQPQPASATLSSPAARTSTAGAPTNGETYDSNVAVSATLHAPATPAGQSSTTNCFSQAHGGVSAGIDAGAARHVSQESVDFSALMGGRQSPDAFVGLSARFGR